MPLTPPKIVKTSHGQRVTTRSPHFAVQRTFDHYFPGREAVGRPATETVTLTGWATFSLRDATEARKLSKKRGTHQACVLGPTVQDVYDDYGDFVSEYHTTQSIRCYRNGKAVRKARE